MKTFQDLIDETLEIKDLDELESAADLFEFGLEKGYYSKKQVDEFNNIYWRVKNKCLAYNVVEKTGGNILDIINIVSKAPADMKNDENELMHYVNGRIKALKGKVTGLK
ncbi:hypothetical protein [Clostridium brassicae]|uniref:Uncharacterized protein n=1 Tax=Clostridium brassicae TaxID=2999072 RepID=A0ABT4D539_9CLOT|nr:hypothetical protein [Clostridium brassicae]MCY6957308.1 hypothetical protein [Clostridium brassicae]